MRLYPGDIGIEPQLDPPDDPPLGECEQCGGEYEVDPHRFEIHCEQCAEVIGMDHYELVSEVLDLRAQVARLRHPSRHGKVLQELEAERFRA